MQRVSTDAVPLDRFGSHGVTIVHPTTGPQALLQTSGAASLVLARLDAGGVLGRHPATGRQLLVVVAGTVGVSGGDGELLELTDDDAVLFDTGEQHETTAITPAVLSLLEWRN